MAAKKSSLNKLDKPFPSKARQSGAFFKSTLGQSEKSAKARSQKTRRK